MMIVNARIVVMIYVDDRITAMNVVGQRMVAIIIFEKKVLMYLPWLACITDLPASQNEEMCMMKWEAAYATGRRREATEMKEGGCDNEYAMICRGSADMY